jgi:hypothetical protein
MMMIWGCGWTGGVLAVTWLLPGDPHWVAEPTSIQVVGEATAIGAATIAATAAPAVISGARWETVKRTRTIL